jgi:hypothetical protein
MKETKAIMGIIVGAIGGAQGGFIGGSLELHPILVGLTAGVLTLATYGMVRLILKWKHFFAYYAHSR